jgi:ATP phosphoribosyltransferase
LQRDRFTRVRELFERAQPLNDDQRRILLDHECAGDAELRDEVESLLAADDSPVDDSDVLARQGLQVDIIKLYGAMELAPIMGLADQIVDIVDTGNTLRANGLEPLELIAPISSRLVVGQASMKMKYDLIQPIVDSMAQAVVARRGA